MCSPLLVPPSRNPTMGRAMRRSKARPLFRNSAKVLKMSFIKKHLKAFGVGLALVGAVALEGCQQTFEDDYEHSSSVYGESDSGVWEKIDEAAQGG